MENRPRSDVGKSHHCVTSSVEFERRRSGHFSEVFQKRPLSHGDFYLEEVTQQSPRLRVPLATLGNHPKMSLPRRGCEILDPRKGRHWLWPKNHLPSQIGKCLLQLFPL